MNKRWSLFLSFFLALSLVISGVGFSPAQAAGSTWVVNSALADNSNCTVAVRQCKTIQAAIDAASTGDTINILAGSFTENLTIDKGLTLAGAGQGKTFLYSAVSEPVCAGGSLCGSAHMILVEADDVTIYGFTIDGDNPAITSGVVVNGADVDARNGIITNHNLGVYDNLVVYANTVKNIYLRGVYASSGGTFNFHHNTVDNVDGSTSSIALFNFYGSGAISFNTVSNANDAIASNWSQGTQYLNNTITNSGSGVHSDNNQTTGDLLGWNTVSNCKPNGYGVWVFSPFVAPTIEGNLVTNCQVGLAVARQNAAVTPLIINNSVVGPGTADSIGLYVTTDGFGWGSTNVSVYAIGNTLTGADYGVYLEEQATYTMDAELHSNNISGNITVGLEKMGTSTADITYNWWGSDAGPGVGGNNGVVGNADYDPWSLALISSSTGSTHEIGETSTLDTHVTATGVYGAQLHVLHNTAVLNFTSGVHNDVASTPAWAWDFVAENFIAVLGGGTRLSGSLQSNLHPVGANLTGQSVATWTYTCAAAGNSSLTYDSTTGTGTYLADIDGFQIPAAMTGDSVTCLAATASVDGYIKLQGRLGSSLSPAGWNDAVVTLTCVDTVGGCTGFGPYLMTTDSTGYYQLVKSGPGSGVALGNYAVSVTRRAYLSSSRTATVAIVAGANTIDSLAGAPILRGGEVTNDGTISIADLSAIGGAFGTTVVPADTGSDVNGDGYVNIFDLVLAGGNYGLSAPQSW
jgi:hypothetical protein